MGAPPGARGGPPPLAPFGLVLHHDGRWSHEGQPIRNRRLREHFDRSVVYLPDEGKYVVTLRHFRGEIEPQEAAFFVRDLDLETASLQPTSKAARPMNVTNISQRDPSVPGPNCEISDPGN